MNKLVEQYIEELYLTEDISSIISKIQSKKSSIMSALRTKDPDTVKAALNFLPPIPIEKIHDMASKHIVGFNVEYDKAIKKAEGTPEERQIKATAIATLYAIKKNVKIPEVRKALSDYKIDYSYSFVLRDIFVGLCLVALGYMMYIIGGITLTGIGIGASAVGAGAVAAGGALVTVAWWVALFVSIYLLLFVLANGIGA